MQVRPAKKLYQNAKIYTQRKKLACPPHHHLMNDPPMLKLLFQVSTTPIYFDTPFKKKTRTNIILTHSSDANSPPPHTQLSSVEYVKKTNSMNSFFRLLIFVCWQQTSLFHQLAMHTYQYESIIYQDGFYSSKHV